MVKATSTTDETTGCKGARGRLVDIEGRRLFAAVAGRGAPPAVFEGRRRSEGPHPRPDGTVRSAEPGFAHATMTAG